MPSFSRSGNVFLVSMVTGPSHVRVGVSFGASEEGLVMTALAPIGNCDHGGLDEQRVREAVLEGVHSANKEYSSELVATEIQYVPNDSADYGLFRRCGYLLAKAVHDGAHFDEVAPPGATT